MNKRHATYDLPEQRSPHDEMQMQRTIKVPFFRPLIVEDEIDEVQRCLRSGWLTTGPRVKEFEDRFAEHVGAEHAVALNSCTAALHLAVEALGLGPGHAVLVPTMTFAATAEIVRYQGALPVLVDCDPETCNMDLDDAAHKLQILRDGWLSRKIPEDVQMVGMIPVHVGGHMMDLDAIHAFAEKYGLWVVEDAAHSFPAAWRRDSDCSWQWCGQETADVTCYSFYANKTITLGEGGMAVMGKKALEDRMRIMALHGLSRDAWGRFAAGGSWDYRIVAPGYKYNLTDIAAAIGIHQLRRAHAMRDTRERLAYSYLEAFADVDELEMPPVPDNRIHAWHLFPIRLRLERLTVDRDAFVDALAADGVGFSVHWRPLHLHPYYQETFEWTEDLLPLSTAEWKRRLTLPLFPDMRSEEQKHVIHVVKDLCRRFAKSVTTSSERSSV